MIIRNKVTQLSIPVQELGIIAVASFTAMAGHSTKRVRKQAFRRTKQVLLMTGLVNAKDIVHSIAQGVTADGVVTIEVTVTEVNEDETNN